MTRLFFPPKTSATSLSRFSLWRWRREFKQRNNRSLKKGKKVSATQDTNEEDDEGEEKSDLVQYEKAKRRARTGGKELDLLGEHAVSFASEEAKRAFMAFKKHEVEGRLRKCFVKKEAHKKTINGLKASANECKRNLASIREKLKEERESLEHVRQKIEDLTNLNVDT